MACRVRIDRLLVERGLFESRAKAQSAIAAGRVTADDVVVAKPSEEISADAVLRAEPAHPYVSRGGVKLAAALDHFRRSEEHTSELQSLRHLVCRLLLEKKKTK